MITYYVGLATGSSGNSGLTSSARKKTVAQALALCVAGDCIRVGESFKPDNSSVSAWNASTWPEFDSALANIKLILELGCEIWGMNTLPEVVADAPVGGTDAYECTLAAGYLLDACYHDYENTGAWYQGSASRKLSNRQLAWVSSRATCLTTPWTWYYNPATGVHTRNCNGEVPNILYGRGRNASSIYATTPGDHEYNGFQVSNQVRDLTIAGTVAFRGINPHSATAGYGFFVSGGSSRVKVTATWTADDMGYHGGGAAGAGNQTHNEIHNFDIGTCGPNSTHLVFFAGTAGCTVHGCAGRYGKIHLCPHLKPDNTVVRNVVGLVGLFGHTNYVDGLGALLDPPNVITDLEYSDIDVYGYGYTNTNVMNCANAQPYTGSEFSEEGRPVRFIRIRAHNCERLSLTEQPLLKDCQIDLSNAGAANTSQAGAILILSSPTGQVVKNRPLLAGCVITANLDRAGTAVYCAAIKPGGNAEFSVGDGLSMMNTTMIDQSTQTQDVYWFLYRLNVSIGARGCAFAVQTKTAASSFFCGSDNALPASDHDFKTCAYIGFGTNNMSSNGTFNTQAEWTSLVDTGTGELAPLFSSSYAACAFVSATTGAITPDSILNGQRNPSSHVIRGINGFTHNGCIGAWQLGSVNAPTQFILEEEDP